MKLPLAVGVPVQTFVPLLPATLFQATFMLWLAGKPLAVTVTDVPGAPAARGGGQDSRSMLRAPRPSDALVWPTPT